MSITSPDRPGLPDFLHQTLKNMGRPGYKANYVVQVGVVRTILCHTLATLLAYSIGIYFTIGLCFSIGPPGHDGNE